MMKKLKQYKMPIGILFSFFGIQIARIIMEVFKIETTITNYIFILALILLIDIKSLSHIRLNKKSLPYIGYQILVLIYAFCAGEKLFTPIIGIIYTLFSLAFIILLFTNRVDNFNGDIFIKLGWWITSLGSILLCYLCTDGLSAFSGIKTLSQGSDRLTLSVIPFAFLIFTLLFKKKNIYISFYNIVSVVAALISIFICSRKGLLVSFAVVLLVHFLRDKKNIYKKIKNICIFLIISFIAINLMINFVPQITELANNYIKVFNDSILGYFGKVEGQYNSGAMRNLNLENAIYIYNNNYTFIEYLFGKGYGFMNIDLPYLTAFFDLGIFGGVFYFALEFIIPFYIILQKTYDKCFKFAQYYSIVVIFQNIYSGVSYGQYKFVPIVFLVFMYCKNIQLKRGNLSQ